MPASGIWVPAFAGTTTERRHAPRRRYRSPGAQRRRLRALEGVLPQAARLPRLQAQIRLRRHGRLEQRQDAVLDRRRRRAGAKAQVPQGRHRLPPLRLRGCEPQRRGRARCVSRRARHGRGRSAWRILRPLLLRGLFHRSRRHEARSHGVQAAGEEAAGGKEVSRRCFYDSHARVAFSIVNINRKQWNLGWRSFPTPAGWFFARVPDQQRTASLTLALHRVRDTRVPSDAFATPIHFSNSASRSRSSTDTFRSQEIYSKCSLPGKQPAAARSRTARMRATREFSLARPRLNPCAGGASIGPPPAKAGKPTPEERHGQGSDAQQQGKEEAEGGVEQEEKGRPRPLAVCFGTGAAPARAESLRQEELTERRRGASARPCGESRLARARCEAGARSQRYSAAMIPPAAE